jgi:hypothetical protein
MSNSTVIAVEAASPSARKRGYDLAATTLMLAAAGVYWITPGMDPRLALKRLPISEFPQRPATVAVVPSGSGQLSNPRYIAVVKPTPIVDVGGEPTDLVSVAQALPVVSSRTQVAATAVRTTMPESKLELNQKMPNIVSAPPAADPVAVVNPMVVVLPEVSDSPPEPKSDPLPEAVSRMEDSVPRAYPIPAMLTNPRIPRGNFVMQRGQIGALEAMGDFGMNFNGLATGKSHVSPRIDHGPPVRKPEIAEGSTSAPPAPPLPVIIPQVKVTQIPNDPKAAPTKRTVVAANKPKPKPKETPPAPPETKSKGNFFKRGLTGFINKLETDSWDGKDRTGFKQKKP